ncbi:MAG: hypothetical protein BA066_07930 [Candidatus Korarchaeota archaeon NZ13-K]|nr:MAG: hypothetical protein BA066_07930 [Candidatus Korarchaeota archaeon NZ13-K]
MLKEAIRDLKDLVSEALSKGYAEGEIQESIFEDVEIETEKDLDEMFHKDVPHALKKALREAGLMCRIFHKKKDIHGPEFLANCETKHGIPVALELEVEHDPVDKEVNLLYVYAAGGTHWSPNRLVYYHEV